MRLSNAVLIVAGAAVRSVEGFALFPSSPKVSYRFMSEPSDTSFDSAASSIEVESETYIPTDKEALVSSVIDTLPLPALGEVSKETRTAINEALLKLEAMNPTLNPTTSPLLNGVWELRYAAGYTPDWALPSPTR